MRIGQILLLKFPHDGHFEGFTVSNPNILSRSFCHTSDNLDQDGTCKLKIDN
jgi:hypothetical protein